MKNTVIDIWTPPAGTESSSKFKVSAQAAGGAWNELFVYKILVGQQDECVSRIASSMVRFDCMGEIRLKISYSGAMKDVDVRPASRCGGYELQNGELYLTLDQTDGDNPVYLAVLVNGSCDSECLHIITGAPEENAPRKADANVLVIGAGDEIPLTLPQGKDTYYFCAGVHSLPQGLWVDVDLGDAYPLDRVELVQAKPRSDSSKDIHERDALHYNRGTQKYIVYGKAEESGAYEVLVDNSAGAGEPYVTHSHTIAPKQCRYLRLVLLGNAAASDVADKRYILSSVAAGLRVYAGGSGDLAQGRAVGGAVSEYAALCDGSGDTVIYTKGSVDYAANWHAAESFHVFSGTTLYLEKGSVVYGSILGDCADRVTISGRGILNCCRLLHTSTYFEGRSGAIWLNNGSDNCVEGITILDAPMWALVLNYSRRPVVRNIAFFGSIVNADGVHFSGRLKRAGRPVGTL